MSAGRHVHAATLLPDGRVLISGGASDASVLASAEIYDPALGAWSLTGSMSIPRFGHGATLLSDGRVLVSGGATNGGDLASAEIYDPALGTWSPTGPMNNARNGHTATLLPSGRVLVGGGVNSNGFNELASAEIYDPALGTWSLTGSMSTRRNVPTATLLPDGRVLVSGGLRSSSVWASAEIYNPALGTWSFTGSMSNARYFHTATLLPGGRVLVSGGASGCCFLASAEIYDPALGTWSLTTSMSTPRQIHASTLLSDGLVLVSGGYTGGSPVASAELYDPVLGTWSLTGSMSGARYWHTSTLLPDGRVLVSGGYNAGSLASAEILDSTPEGPPTLTSSSFYGGAGDQRGTGAAAGGGALYVSGNVQPETGNAGDAALVLKYALPSGPSPVWARSYGFGTLFYAVAATNEGVYADGINYSLTTDGVGGKEVKSFLAKFAPDGSNGPAPGGAVWLATPHFFAYTGSEYFAAATTAVEGGSNFIYAAGGGQPCSSSAYAIAKFDTSGSLLAKATDPGQEGAFTSCSFSGTSSAGNGVTVLNGNVYAVGSRDGGGATIWKHAPNLSVVWRRQRTDIPAAQFLGVAGFGSAIYAVGNTSTGPNTENYLIDKYDEAGNLLWTQTSGGSNTDVLTGVVGIGGRLFAVGYTLSSGAGGADSVVLEIDPATGATLSTTLFGGALDDKARGATTDGTDLYVVGESRSFGSAGGNVVGQNDVTLLRYSLTLSIPGCLNVTCTASDQCHDAGVCDPTTGACSNPAKADGASCTDGNACTTGDACGSGTCQPGAGTLDVDDGNPCTVDTCNASTGAVNTPGNAGTVCRGSGGECDPAETCTGSSSACPADAFVSNGTGCTDDGNACSADFCSNGSCSHPVDAHCASCVGNAPPAVAQPSANPSAPVPFSGSGVNVTITANYTDVNTGPHTCVIAWGDGTSSPPSGSTAVTEPVGANPGTCSGAHTYAPTTNVYEVSVRVTDDCGVSGSNVYQYVVVYDSNGGFVTGVGRINSPPQAYLYSPTAVGTANFGFVSKYKKGTTIPDGDTSFNFSAVGFKFDSDTYEWFVISGAKARFRGTGSVNGSPGYGFELTAWDGQVTGGGGVDRFRIKIWQGNPGNVIYDNERGSPDGVDPVTALQSGSIVLHKK